MMRIVVTGLVLWLGLGSGCSAGRMVGEPCEAASDCPAMLCEDIGTSGLACTQPCDAATPCPDPWVCGTDGACVAACAAGSVAGTGAERRICVGDVFVPCSTRDPAADCTSCGCAPFGGGVCIAGRGCVPPAPDGTACMTATECASGVCYSDTGVCGPGRADGEPCGAASDCAGPRCFADTGTCGALRADGEPCSEAADCASDSCLADGTCGAPRAMGGPCLVDADCETSNCSTNGLGTTPGLCMQPLGSLCRSSEGTCQRCLNEDAFTGVSGRCFRNRCDPTRAPTCPAFDRHEFACAESTVAGEYYCFERCTPDEDGDRTGHNCYDAFDSCLGGESFCR